MDNRAEEYRTTEIAPGVRRRGVMAVFAARAQHPAVPVIDFLHPVWVYS